MNPLQRWCYNRGRHYWYACAYGAQPRFWWKPFIDFYTRRMFLVARSKGGA